MSDRYVSEREGYAPHNDQSRAVCPRCGGGVFRCEGQSVPGSADVWCWEHTCERCGWILGVEVRRD